MSSITCPSCNKKLGPKSRFLGILTPIQQDVVDGIVRGKTVTEIAGDIGKTPHNVSVQLGYALRVLGLTNCVQLTLLAYDLIDGKDLGLDNALRAVVNGVARTRVRASSNGVPRPNIRNNGVYAIREMDS